ncbi:MAG: RNA pseudouridine synthase [Spirochaetaceae bacterium]|nr:RNA pseudouridine synthase [Spirochaetaceae bacterium]
MKKGALFPERVLHISGSFAVVLKLPGEICESGDNSALSANLLPALLRDTISAVSGRKIDYLEAVHRLDRPVSGCVLLAFDRDTFSRFSGLFSQGLIQKTYWAVVESSAKTSGFDKAPGFDPLSSGLAGPVRLSHYIRFSTKTQKAVVMPADTPPENLTGKDWRNAELLWTCIAQGDRYSLLEVRTITGRTHQIRAQLSAAGMPIKGDVKYGARRSDPLGGIRLHARSLSFPDSGGEEPHTVFAPLPVTDSLWEALTEQAGRGGASGSEE